MLIGGDSILRSRVITIFIATLIAALITGVASTTVSAQPASTNQQAADKQAEFNQIQAQTNEINNQLDVIVEQYNEANLALGKTEKELQSQEAQIQAAEKNLSMYQLMINKRFASVYRQGDLSLLDALFASKSLDQFLYYVELSERQSDQDARAMEKIRLVKKEIEVQNASLLEKEKKQKELINEVKSKKNEIIAQLKAKNDLLAQIKGQLADLRKKEQAEQAAAQAELRKKLMAAVPVTVSRGGGRSSVVAIALSLLGRPYVWGGSGPYDFDCSGLTMYVYRQVGISLPHSAAAQYNCGTHVSRDQLQPGDLVFFSYGGYISHVGMYVGHGSFINAPHTGAVVSIASLNGRSGYVGATRP